MGYKVLLFFTLLLLPITTLFPQAIVVTPATTPAEWQTAIQSLAGKGVAIQNINVSCDDGAFGSFVKNDDEFDGAHVLDFDLSDGGLILSSGNVATAVGPTGACPGNVNSGVMNEPDPSDPDLVQSLGSNDLQDLCYITFEVIPAGDNLQFNYVFASEEYPDYVCTGFNDIFGFYVYGPGFDGGPFQNGAYNISTVPGTGLPVAIGSINNGQNCAGNPCNNNSFGMNCPCSPEYYIDNTADFAPHNDVISFDGMTRRLTAYVDPVIPCETYFFKLAIADKGDQIFDSGVFIESGSLISNVADIQATGTYEASVPDPENPSEMINAVVAVEGCLNFPYQLNFDLESDDDAILNLIIGGNAENGIDYEFLDDTVFIPAGTESVDLEIVPILNDDNELDLLTIELESIEIGSCAFPLSDILHVYILDNSLADNKINFNQADFGAIVDTVTNSMVVCPGPQGAPLEAYSLNYQTVLWEPFEVVDNPFNPKPAITITEDTWVYATFTIQDCEYRDSFFFQVPTPPTILPEYTVCPERSIQMDISGASSLGAVEWTSPSDPSLIDFLDDPTSLTPTFNATDDQLSSVDFVVSVPYEASNATGNFICYHDLQTTVNIAPVDLFSGIQGTWFKCPGDPLQIEVPGAVDGTYEWTFGDGSTSSNALSSVLVGDDVEQVISIVAEDINGCPDEVSVEVRMLEDLADAGDTFVDCFNTSGTIGSPAVDGYTYTWTPATGLDNPNTAQPNVSLDTLVGGLNQSITYTVSMFNPSYNCSFTDDVTISVNGKPEVYASIAGNHPVVLGGATTLQASGILGDATYIWNGDGLLNAEGEFVTVRPTQLGFTTYELTGYDENGCFKSAEITVEATPPPNFLIPNAFSPNNDGFNDSFRPLLYNVQDIMKFTIYNRWGEQVYVGTGMNAAWDGTLKGVKQNVGVYMWHIEYLENGAVAPTSQKGNVTLVR